MRRFQFHLYSGQATNRIRFGYESFTGTWKAFHSGELSSEELRGAQVLLFNCIREHIFGFTPEDSTLPMEVTWVEDCDSIHESEPRVERKEIPKKVLQKFMEFRSIVGALDREGKVEYRWQLHFIEKHGGAELDHKIRKMYEVA
tara:strand:+ start:123 stop:554 length:432 start_codon:yes stop_codon:yes gene_type:complete